MNDRELLKVVHEGFADAGFDYASLDDQEKAMFVVDFKTAVYRFGRDYPMALAAAQGPRSE